MGRSCPLPASERSGQSKQTVCASQAAGGTSADSADNKTVSTPPKPNWWLILATVLTNLLALFVMLIVVAVIFGPEPNRGADEAAPEPTKTSL